MWGHSADTVAAEMEECARCDVRRIILVGGAETGKTALLSMWAGAAKAPHIWLGDDLLHGVKWKDTLSKAIASVSDGTGHIFIDDVDCSPKAVQDYLAWQLANNPRTRVAMSSSPDSVHPDLCRVAVRVDLPPLDEDRFKRIVVHCCASKGLHVTPADVIRACSGDTSSPRTTCCTIWQAAALPGCAETSSTHARRFLEDARAGNTQGAYAAAARATRCGDSVTEFAGKLHRCMEESTSDALVLDLAAEILVRAVVSACGEYNDDISMALLADEFSQFFRQHIQ